MHNTVAGAERRPLRNGSFGSCSFYVPCLFFAFLFFIPFQSIASGPFSPPDRLPEFVFSTADYPVSPALKKENSRLVAALLSVALGPLGGHRLYLGTRPGVPMIYVATLGGGFFVLPLIDLGHILFTKDLDRLQHNEHVFLWRN